MLTKDFIYKFDEGPLDSVDELVGDWTLGNCRRAWQYFIFQYKGVFLPSEKVLCPEAYDKTGAFVIKESESFDLTKLQMGDIIYAERIKKKDGTPVDKSPSFFKNREEYIISLHTAVYNSEKDKEIWHATAIEGKSCFWSLVKFLEYYKPIAVKRILSANN